MDFPLHVLSHILYYSYHETHLPDLFNHPDTSTTSIISSLLNHLTPLLV
jgi:hypothetical protein